MSSISQTISFPDAGDGVAAAERRRAAAPAEAGPGLSEEQASLLMRLQAAALEATASAVVITDRDGTIRWVNAGFTRLTGYAADEAIGQNPRILKSGKHDEAFYRQVWETICRGETWHGEMINRRKDGTLYHEDMTISPVGNAGGSGSGISHFISVKKDVTERIRSALALRDSERRLRAVVNTAMDGILTADEGGIIESVNRAIERLFGYRAGSLIGKSVGVLMPEAERDAGRACEFLRGGRGKGVDGVREVVGRRRDGSTFPLEVAVDEVRLGGRRTFVGVMRDVSERRQLEREVLHVSENEQARIGRDLHDDICQRLMAAALGLQVLETKLADGRCCPAAEAAEVAKIRELLEQTNAQTRDLARGLYPLQLARGGLPAALEEMAALVCTHSNVACACHCDETVRPGEAAVAVHLYRIAQEAISNGLRHSRGTCLELRLARKRGRTELSIADDGVGLPRDFSVEVPPAGMGIQTMRYRARVIGASLELRARPGGGTVVICSLADPPAVARPAAARARAERHGKKGRR